MSEYKNVPIPIDYPGWTSHPGPDKTFYTRRRRDTDFITTSVIVNGTPANPTSVEGIISANDGRGITILVIPNLKPKSGTIYITNTFYRNEQCAAWRKTSILHFNIEVNDLGEVAKSEGHFEGSRHTLGINELQDMEIPIILGQKIDIEALMNKFMNLEFGLPVRKQEILQFLTAETEPTQAS